MSTNSTESQGNAVPRIRDPGFQEFYANQLLINMSPFDIALTFQKVTEIVPGQQGVVDLVNISISPQQFKAMSKLITNTIEAYEENYGRLTIPDQEIEPKLSKNELSKLISESLTKSRETGKKIKQK